MPMSATILAVPFVKLSDERVKVRDRGDVDDEFSHDYVNPRTYKVNGIVAVDTG